MNLKTIENDIREHVEDWMDKGRDLLETKLPVLADIADKAEGNDLVDAALNAVHVPPTMLGALADMVTKLDAELAKTNPPETPSGIDAQDDDTAPASTTAPAASQPEPAAPAGPVIAGQAS